MSYSALAKVGPAYPTGQVTTGDPLFLRLVGAVDFRFAYRFASSARHRLTGTAALSAVVSSSTGWHRTITLQPPTAFSGDRAVARGKLAVGALPTLIANVEKTTQVPGSYKVTIQPRVLVHGQVAGFQRVRRSRGPLEFSLSADELQPQIPKPSGTGAAASPLHPTSSGSVAATRRATAYISLKVTRLSVSEARAVAAPGIVVTVLILLSCAVLVRRAGPPTKRPGSARGIATG